MKKILILLIACAAVMPAMAMSEEQPNEVSLFYGYMWADGRVADHSVYGLTYERVFPESGGWGLMFKLERLSTRYSGVDLDADFLDISTTYTFPWKHAAVYVPAGIGVTDSSGPGSGSAGGLSAHVGLGYKFAFTSNVGLRIDARYRYADELADSSNGRKLNLFETTFGIGWSW
jgi:hypothetical protein